MQQLRLSFPDHACPLQTAILESTASAPVCRLHQAPRRCSKSRIQNGTPATIHLVVRHRAPCESRIRACAGSRRAPPDHKSQWPQETERWPQKSSPAQRQNAGVQPSLRAPGPSWQRRRAANRNPFDERCRGLALLLQKDRHPYAPQASCSKKEARHAASSSWPPESCPTPAVLRRQRRDRKSTRLNSSHGYISYAVFCLKKKKTDTAHGSWPTFTYMAIFCPAIPDISVRLLRTTTRARLNCTISNTPVDGSP